MSAELGFAGAGDVTGCRLDCATATTVDSSAATTAEADIVSKIVKILRLASVANWAVSRCHLAAKPGYRK